VQKKSMAMILVVCFLTVTLLSSAPLIGNLWGGIGVATAVCGDTTTSLVAVGGGVYSGLLWTGICAFGVASAGVGFAIGAGVVL